MTAPLLEVSVWRKGLIVRAKLISEHAIFATEILRIRGRQTLFQQGVEIEHLGIGSKSPLVLYRAIGDPIVMAIRKTVDDEARAAIPIEGAQWVLTPAPPGVPSPAPNPAVEAEPQTAALLRWNLANEAAVRGLEPRWLATLLEALGLGVGLLLLATGLLWAIPKLGGFGTLWTVAAAAMLAWNGSTFIRRHFIAPESAPPTDAPDEAASKK